VPGLAGRQRGLGGEAPLTGAVGGAAAAAAAAAKEKLAAATAGVFYLHVSLEAQLLVLLLRRVWCVTSYYYKALRHTTTVQP
jgi:hypothetical protein